jgi:isopentenyl diphosphate isomerase/L-lactate dehydrogenase-like FMN-dependent dehydrogenase
VPPVTNLSQYEDLARAVMEPAAFDYVAGGAGAEITLRENVGAFERRRLRPTVLVDVSSVDTTTTMLGSAAALPIGLAPAALQAVVHPDGELASARAAMRSGVVFCLSTLSSRSIEEVAETGHGSRWFQLYVHKDRGVSRDLVVRAEAAGYKAIVLTVDLPVTGYRERDLVSRFAVSAESYGNLDAPPIASGELLATVSQLNDQSLNWGDIEWLRGVTELPLVIKGVLRGDDADLAVRSGAAAVVVSNHGGRQLDRVLATLDALEEVVCSVEGRAEVYLDGGVRRGIDIVTAVALGARAVFLGRPYLYALATGGEDGVVAALDLLKTELVIAMTLLGTPAVGSIERSHVA